MTTETTTYYEINVPLKADLARALDIIEECCASEGLSITTKTKLAGAYIIDPEGVLQWQVVHSTGIGRSTQEVLRVLQALQSGGICGVDWKPGHQHA